MRRLKYASVFSRDLTPSDLNEIAEVSARNNAELEITGAMLAAGNVFFQILEGPEEAVGELYEKIVRDGRHEKILLLRDERGVESRLFGRWSMKLVEFQSENALHLETLEGVIEAMQLQMAAATKLASVLELAIWREYGKLPEED